MEIDKRSDQTNDLQSLTSRNVVFDKQNLNFHSTNENDLEMKQLIHVYHIFFYLILYVPVNIFFSHVWTDTVLKQGLFCLAQ